MERTDSAPAPGTPAQEETIDVSALRAAVGELNTAFVRQLVTVFGRVVRAQVVELRVSLRTGSTRSLEATVRSIVGSARYMGALRLAQAVAKVGLVESMAERDMATVEEELSRALSALELLSARAA